MTINTTSLDGPAPARLRIPTPGGAIETPVGAAALDIVSAGPGGPVLDIVVPVYNEERDLVPAVTRLRDYLQQRLPFSFRITIANNASTDATARLADQLADSFDEVIVVELAAKGRGRALNTVWSASDAAVLAYMDVDLSTDLAALLPLVAPLVSGHSDLAIGTRLHRGSRVVRGPRREFISRCYNLILRGTLSAHFSDAQCGFKAIRADVARRLLPLVKDTGWFFDTELLVLAERSGLRIHEVPVDWVDDPDSTVDIVATAVADLKGVARVGRALFTGALPVSQLRAQLGREPIADATPDVPTGMLRQLVRFSIIGIVSTAVYLLLYLLLRGVMPAQPANFLALASCAVANTAANRRLTFGVRGRDDAGKHQLQGFMVFLLGFGISALALFGLHHFAPDASTAAELAVLLVSGLVGTLARFVLMRGWIFRQRCSIALDPVR
ncbi:bifunctional glycosyltransferase family 2/GtrA family protein [Nakamurella lactea]|uniref:bifunctional glycosyltransferase family 2/GtrA family protein n=1 Tax=Nakamurella lactea TaxID=459515 RepID=UPI000429A5EC|nr:bifunctional glycosyltransferase family 2/GtrA family protein [Nakamurella lactea]